DGGAFGKAFRAEGHAEVAAALQPAALQDRDDQVARSAGGHGALEDVELAGTHGRTERFAGAEELFLGHPAVPVDGCSHGYDDDIGGGSRGVVAADGEAAGRATFLQ